MITNICVCLRMNNSFSPRTPRKRTGEKRGSPRAESGAQQEAPGPGTRWLWPLPVSVTRGWRFQQRVCPLRRGEGRRHSQALTSLVALTFFPRYGVVLRKLDLVKEAIDVFVEATHVLPLHWGAWLELCNLITDKEMVS